MKSKIINKFMNWCFDEEIKIFHELPIIIITIIVNFFITFLILFIDNLNKLITTTNEYTANELSIFYTINIIFMILILILILINYILSRELQGFNWLFYITYLVIIILNGISILEFNSYMFLELLYIHIILRVYLILLLIYTFRYHKRMKKIKKKREEKVKK